MGVTEFLATYITAFIQSTGYITVFIGMVMESMILPVPSEAIMPFAGFLVAMKKFTLEGVIIVSTLGSLVGSLLSYYIGYYGGKPFIRKFGRYVLLDEEELEATEHFFKHKGQIAIFVGRMIPVVRHLISIPAGMGRMNIIKFIIFTVIGAGIRNSFLAIVGKTLKEHRDKVMEYSEIIDVVVIVILLVIIGLFIYRQLKKRKRIRKYSKFS